MLSWQPPPFGGTAPPLWPVGFPSGTFYHTRLEIFRQLFLTINLLKKQIFYFFELYTITKDAH